MNKLPESCLDYPTVISHGSFTSTVVTPRELISRSTYFKKLFLEGRLDPDFEIDEKKKIVRINLACPFAEEWTKGEWTVCLGLLQPEKRRRVSKKLSLEHLYTALSFADYLDDKSASRLLVQLFSDACENIKLSEFTSDSLFALLEFEVFVDLFRSIGRKLGPERTTKAAHSSLLSDFKEKFDCLTSEKIRTFIREWTNVCRELGFFSLEFIDVFEEHELVKKMVGTTQLNLDKDSFENQFKKDSGHGWLLETKPELVRSMMKIPPGKKSPIISGGAVTAAVCGYSNIGGDIDIWLPTENLHDSPCLASYSHQMDCFCSAVEQTVQWIERLAPFPKQKYKDTGKITTGYIDETCSTKAFTIEIVGCSPLQVLFNNNQGEFPLGVLETFDIECVLAWYDLFEKKLFASFRALDSWITRNSDFHKIERVTERRIVKYTSRGFLFPECPKHITLDERIGLTPDVPKDQHLYVRNHGEPMSMKTVLLVDEKSIEFGKRRLKDWWTRRIRQRDHKFGGRLNLPFDLRLVLRNITFSSAFDNEKKKYYYFRVLLEDTARDFMEWLLDIFITAIRNLIDEGKILMRMESQFDAVLREMPSTTTLISDPTFIARGIKNYSVQSLVRNFPYNAETKELTVRIPHSRAAPLLQNLGEKLNICVRLEKIVWVDKLEGIFVPAQIVYVTKDNRKRKRKGEEEE